jgi:hypothetical protein
MGLTTRWVGTEPKGAMTDGTHGTDETNSISLGIDTELASGILMVLLAPALITDSLITDYFHLWSRLPFFALASRWAFFFGGAVLALFIRVGTTV